MIEAKRIAEVMGGKSVLGRVVSSIEELEEIVGEGLPKIALRITVRRVFVAAREANRYLYRVVPEATYKRRTGKLRIPESERTERLARVIAAAEGAWQRLGRIRYRFAVHVREMILVEWAHDTVPRAHLTLTLIKISPLAVPRGRARRAAPPAACG